MTTQDLKNFLLDNSTLAFVETLEFLMSDIFKIVVDNTVSSLSTYYD